MSRWNRVIAGNGIVVLLAIVRTIAALIQPITDCDETFNYWEPTHFVLYGYGMQTWEYSPVYGLRSYIYILFHAFIAKCGQLLYVEHLWGRIGIFYFIRVVLGLICASAECYLIRAVRRRFSQSIAVFLSVFLLVSPGMFHASVSYLPQSFTMCTLMAAFGAWLNHRHGWAVLWMGVSSLIGWPFSVLIGVGMGLDIVYRSGIIRSIRWFVIAASACLLPMITLDRLFYGKWLFASLNIAIYNAPSTDRSEGSNLYGVEPWYFFGLNLFLNFNVVLLLSAASVVVAVAVWLWTHVCGGRVHPNGDDAGPIPVITRRLVATNDLFLRVACFACWGWIAVMSVQPHKEERFLFVIYPLLCLTASYGLVTVIELWLRRFVYYRPASKAGTASSAGATTKPNNSKSSAKPNARASGSSSGEAASGDGDDESDEQPQRRYAIRDNHAFRLLAAALVLCVGAFVALSVSRTFGYVYNYRAPLRVYGALNTYQTELARIDERLNGHLPPSERHHTLRTSTVCVGKEWYRFPSHFHLAPNTRLGFIKSEFSGQLPQYYADATGSATSVSLFESTSRIPPHMNAINGEEFTRYVQSIDSECDYIVDADLSHQTEPHYALRGNGWDPEPVVSHPFLDTHRSKEAAFRAFHVPVLSQRYNVFAPYQVVRRVRQ